MRAAVVILAGLAVPGVAAAQKAVAYPAKQVRMLVGFAPGGFTDVMARAIAGKLSEAWGEQVVVDNRPGASTTIATDIVAKAPADGYTLLMMTDNFVTNPSLFAKLPYDSERDFAPVTLAAIAPFLLVVHPSLPVKSVKELVALARKRPGELSYGSGGIGSPGHLSGELLGTLAGVSMVHVAYKGAAPALVDAMSGQIQVYFGNLPVTLPHATSGKLRVLAVTSPKRTPAVPELPTVAEAGVAGFELSPWYGVMTRAGVPEPVLDRIESDTVRALRDPEMRARIVKLGGEPVGSSRGEFAAFLKSEAVKWGRLVKASGAKAE
ncbi:MAG: tripartite tricarboxylate transporter substrate binding protein [bacterium]|jgi:tripartite-type tricarboxylate transporter receptor subunit TctC|nr:tripartite tricarboxylate transporter substrate binding protein [Betaproteobacteria bacterium]